jgi:hypothetical protein
MRVDATIDGNVAHPTEIVELWLYALSEEQVSTTARRRRRPDPHEPAALRCLTGNFS